MPESPDYPALTRGQIAVLDRVNSGDAGLPVLQQLVRLAEEALRSPAARARGLYDDAFIAKRLADPSAMRTNLGSNTLWQLATLEIWLQKMGVG